MQKPTDSATALVLDEGWVNVSVWSEVNEVILENYIPHFHQLPLR
jgi:hypothetical protein